MEKMRNHCQMKKKLHEAPRIHLLFVRDWYALSLVVIFYVPSLYGGVYKLKSCSFGRCVCLWGLVVPCSQVLLFVTKFTS